MSEKMTTYTGKDGREAVEQKEKWLRKKRKLCKRKALKIVDAESQRHKQ